MRRILAVVCVLLFAGCGAPKPPRDSNVKPVLKLESFPPEQRAAVVAATRQLTADGENPSEFYAEAEPEDTGVIIVHLLHESAFAWENRGVVGNPGGKCRDVYFDTGQEKITHRYFWQ